MLKQVIICITAVLLFRLPPFEMQGVCAELPKIHITCNAGAFLVGTTASVICNFNKDMNTDKRPISVVRYGKSTFLDDPGTDVLLCQWENKGQSYECELEKGFSIDGNITDHLRLKLPADTGNFTGLYSCFIMHATETLPNACELTVKEEGGVSTTPATHDTHVPQEQGESSLLWLIVLPAILIGVTGVVIVYKCRRTSLRTETNDMQNDTEALSEEDCLLDSKEVSPEASTSCPKASDIEDVLKHLLLSKKALEHVMELLDKEIRASLEGDNTMACPVSLKRLLTKSGATRKLTSGDFAMFPEGQAQTCLLKPNKGGVAFVSATLNVKDVESLQAHCFFSGCTTGQQVAEQVTELKEDEVTLSVKPNDIKPVDKVVIEAKGPANSPMSPSVTVTEVTGIAKPTGAFLVVDLSSTKLLIHLVRLQDPGSKSSPYSLELRHYVRKGKELFDYIAKCVGDFAKKLNLERKKFRLAFVFSFPCTYDPDFGNARLTTWTGEIDCDRVVGENLKEFFQEALKRNKVPDTIKVVTVVNDAVCLLVNAAYGDPNCKIALCLMDGFTACYRPVQGNQATEPSEGNIMKTELITTNIGALGAGSSLKHIETQFDRSLDEDSLHSGQQILEKMVSIMYIGELVRLVLVHLAKKQLLFRTSDIQQLNKKNCLGTEEVSLIEGDMNEELPFTTYVLTKLQIYSNKEDRQTVRYVCKTVSKRAADLAAASVATLINLLDVPEVSVAIEEPIKGSHSEFLKHLEERARELVNPKLNFKIVAPKDGIRNGAALLVAAVSPSFPNKAPTMVPSSASS